MHLSCTNLSHAVPDLQSIGHSVVSVQQTSQRQEEPKCRCCHIRQEVEEEITDSEVTFNNGAGTYTNHQGYIGKKQQWQKVTVGAPQGIEWDQVKHSMAHRGGQLGSNSII